MLIHIKYEKNKLKYEIDNNFYLEDDNIFITIDSGLKDFNYLKKIKELYIKDGINFIYNIDVTNSIYIFDKIKNKLILIRDLVGLKSIYYYVNNNSFYVCNDIMKLMNYNNIEKVINKECLSMFFRFNYIKPPQTIFKNVFKLNHAEYMIIDDNNYLKKVYWDTITSFNNISKNKINDFNESKCQLENIIKKYINKEIKENSNFGVYLSGGIDSSLVAAIACKYYPKIETFSIGFFDKENNEANESKKVAKYLKTNHHELYIREKDILNIVKKIPTYYTEPFADASQFPTIVLNEYAKKNNIKIAFTGDGADQLFCGSSLYDTIFKVQKLSKILNPFNIYINPKYLKYNRKLMYLFSNKKYKSQSDILYKEIYLRGLFNDCGKKRLEREDEVKSNNWQEKRMIIDFDTYICDRINTKMGLAARKNNIEIRSPFLNKDIIEFSFKIPHKYKYNKKNKKYILKKVLYEYIPKNYFIDNKKGFFIPIYKWINTYLIEDIKRLTVKENIEKQGIFNYDAINKLINNIDNRQKSILVWNYYMFQLWYETYMIE